MKMRNGKDGREKCAMCEKMRIEVKDFTSATCG